MSASPVPTAAPGASAPGGRPVQRFVLAQKVTPHAWSDVGGDLIRHMEEQLVLEAFRQGAGLVESPHHKVQPVVWAGDEGMERLTLPGEEPSHYVIRMTAQAVILDG